MARLGAGFAWAAVLGFLVLNVGVRGQIPGLPGLPGSPQLPNCTSPPNVVRPLPITVKIFCRQNQTLRVAVRVNDPADATQNEVVLATNQTDPNQMWQVIYPPVGALTDDEDRYPPFVLVNIGTRQVMMNQNIPVPTDNNYVHVQLAPYKPCLTKVSTLWTMGDSKPEWDGFSEIRTLRSYKRVLDGLRNNVQDGTFVGVFPSKDPEGDNALWKIEPIFP